MFPVFSKDEVDSDGVYADNDDSSDKKKYSTAITIRDTPLERTDGRRSTIFYLPLPHIILKEADSTKG